MAPTAADVARLRRMTNLAANDAVYTDNVLSDYLSSYPTIDGEGRSSDETDWTEGYDLHAAAAEIWAEVAATLQSKHDFSADGASYSSNQMYENAMDQSRYHFARSKVKVKKVVKRPVEKFSATDLYLNIYANIDPPLEDGTGTSWEDL